MRARQVGWVWVTALAALAGCGETATPPTDTGAEAAARDYYEAILRQDWAKAHAALHPDSRARCGPKQFARLAQNYLRNLGFHPREVRVRSCEEHGSEAVAHVVFTGQSSSRRRYYKEAVTLRPSGNGWGVVLPPRFGHARSR
jgi:hypothetical protein